MVNGGGSQCEEEEEEKEGGGVRHTNPPFSENTQFPVSERWVKANIMLSRSSDLEYTVREQHEFR